MSYHPLYPEQARNPNNLENSAHYTSQIEVLLRSVNTLLSIYQNFDFSNGNTHAGLDEGEVLTGQILNKVIKDLKDNGFAVDGYDPTKEVACGTCEDRKEIPCDCSAIVHGHCIDCCGIGYVKCHDCIDPFA